ncbi:MAG TPA: hypothetical protein VK025_02635 [Steroidobacter sp.]|jgi:hypothetical protein|nr:hypothetical protein [Steroidobacteraceae bacterium]HLS80281.1 hypothetical protein [Steroidobacter sp.]
MTNIVNISETVRRSVCFTMAAAIVALGLTLGDLMANSVFLDAYAHANTAQVSVVQLAAL